MPTKLAFLLSALTIAIACQSPPTVGADAPGPARLAGDNVAPNDEDAADVPDLSGLWTARLRSIYKGIGPLGLGSSAGADIDYLTLEIDVEIQSERVFYGTIRSVTRDGEQAPSEEIFGAIHSSGETAVYITRQGRGIMYLTSPEEIEVCGGRGDTDVMLAFCGPLHRADPPEPTDDAGV